LCEDNELTLVLHRKIKSLNVLNLTKKQVSGKTAQCKLVVTHLLLLIIIKNPKTTKVKT